jgi:hypothetical protein
MNSDHSKLRQHESEQLGEAHQSQQSGEQVFAGVEEILRFDSDKNPVPPTVAEKLNESIAQEPATSASWWKKLWKS